MRSAIKFILVIAMLTTAGLLPGCQPPAPSPAPPAGNVGVLAPEELDPCADRLHDLCGALLLYYSKHDKVPASLADLGKTAPPANCPLTGKPYVYDPDGVPMPGGIGSLIVYETRPCSGDTCLAIMAEPYRPGQPLVLRVVHAPQDLIPDAPPNGAGSP